ncbi:hypothetical protein ACVK00_006721 [Burkholderia sp. PvR073]
MERNGANDTGEQCRRGCAGFRGDCGTVMYAVRGRVR